MDREQVLRWTKLFHETYERRAPEFGYVTRSDTKAFNPESSNGRLMLAVVGDVLTIVRNAALEEAQAACVAWGDEKVRKWSASGDDAMIEDAKARAWDALQCAAAIDALRSKP